MADVTQATSIACPPEDVWAVLADFGGISRWAPNVDHSCLTTSQREGAGAVRRVQVGRNALLERVVEWEPGERLAYAIVGLPPVVRAAVNTWSLEADSGATRVTLRTRVDTGPRPPQHLVARAIGRVMGKASVQMLAGLKAHLEEAQSEEVGP
jgi:uncharacterized protein YndB with AHSA1/START domain